ncbi:hypothetical protein Ancab_028196, partial [Ancistrocladus abbreviatus]
MCEIIDRNPELAHILNDPSILRQTLETARNPELMREMRNTNRAMNNIESSGLKDLDAWGGQTNSGPRSNACEDGRAPSIAGLGGVSNLPELERMFSGTPDAALLTQLLQNPAVSQMMHRLVSNPEYMKQIFNMHPQLRAMSDLSPQVREMMQNPELLHQLTSSEMMQ